MLKIADKKQLKAARKLLIEQFEKGNFETFVASITSPEGSIPEAKVYWGKKEELWAHFTETYDGGVERVWKCWCGTNPRRKHSLNPSIGINFPVEQCKKRIKVWGRVLVDDSGKYYLGHKGGLGGGRRPVSIDDFAELIKGFKREPVSWPDGSQEDVFVIGKIDSPEFIGRLQEYVSESERIRELAQEDLKE